MSYAVTLYRTADRELGDLPVHVQRRVLEQLEKLADDPRPPASKELAGELAGLWRVRVGAYRVAYEVDDTAREVSILKIGHRSKFYPALMRQRH